MNYVYRNGYGITVSYQKKILELNLSLQSFLNILCIQRYSTYEGTKQAASILLNTNHKLPIYISEELVLFPSHSIRHNDVVYVNYMNVVYINQHNVNQSLIIFKNGEKLVSKQSLSKMKLQERKTIKLLHNRKFHQLKVFTMLAKQ